MRIGEMVAMNYKMITNMNKYNQMANTSAQRIATGKRVNSAADDPSAIGRIARMEAQMRQSRISTKNIDDGIGLVKTMDTAFSQIHEAALNLSELAVKYKDPGLSASEKTSIEEQAKGYLDEISNYMTNAQYNGSVVFATPQYNVFTSLGDLKIDTTKFSIKANGANYDFTGHDGTALTGKTMADILDSNFVTDNILNPISQARSAVGVKEQILEKRKNFDSVKEVIQTDALSKLQDADTAKETANMAKYQALAAINNQLIASYTSQMQSQIVSLFNALA